MPCNVLNGQKKNWLQKWFGIGCHLVIYWKAKNEALVGTSKKVFLKKDVLRASSRFPSSWARATTKISWMHSYLWCSAARSPRERELRQMYHVCLPIPKGNVTRDDSRRRPLEQHSVAMLDQCSDHSKQCRNDVAMLCCAKNRPCESSLATSP